MDKVVIYKDSAGEYRWKLVASNGQIIAVPGEGYVNLNHCTDMVSSMWDRFAKADIVDETGKIDDDPIVLSEGHGHD